LTTFPAWIDVDGGLGELAAILPELETYRDLAMHWRAVAGALWKLQTGEPVDSPVRLALYVMLHIDDPTVVSVFDELGLTSLHQQIKLAATHLTDVDAPWAKLIKPCNEFNEQYGSGVSSIGLDDGDNSGLVALKIPSLVTDATQDGGHGNLRFKRGRIILSTSRENSTQLARSMVSVARRDMMIVARYICLACLCTTMRAEGAPAVPIARPSDIMSCGIWTASINLATLSR
jgi:hypothetical protein